MATYAIGDIQGCYDELQALLAHIDYQEKQDVLWFAGDLVNRGQKSLDVLRFVSRLPHVVCVLGNHDLSLLALACSETTIKHHTLDAILQAPDRDELLVWLRQQPLYIEHTKLPYVLVHAGIPPSWSLTDTRQYANEVQELLRGDLYQELLTNMFGNEPVSWSNDLAGWDRYRFIINGLTRLRFCTSRGELDFSYKGTLEKAPSYLVPWFELPHVKRIDRTILFGHWAALEGNVISNKVIALDTGCVWGGELTAIRLEDQQKFCVNCKR